jgi:VWFA-related protein
LLGPDDLIGVMTPDMRAKDVVLTRKTQMVEEQLRKNWDWGMETDTIPRLNDYENKLWVCYPPKGGEGEMSALAAALIAKSRQTRSLHAMQDLVTHLGSIREERKAVIAVSGGWQLIRDSDALMKLREGEAPPGVDNITVGPNGKLTRRDPRTTGGGDYMAKSECDAERMRLAQTDNQQEFRDLLDDANRANASFYPIDPEGLRVNPGSSLDRLYELASNTDGIPIVNTNDLHKGVSRVVDDLTSYYLVGYTSTNTKSDGRVRQIQVKVKGSGIQVRHRRSYRAPSTTETASGPPSTSAPPDPGARALSDAIASLGRKPVDSRFSIAAAHLTSGNEATIWIAGHVTTPSGAPDEFLAGGRADLEIQAGDYSTRAQATIEPGERGFVTSVKVPASAVTELNVRARASSEVSSTPITAALASRIGPGLGQPLVQARGPATGNRFAATADRYFTRNERLRVELPVAPGVKLGGARLLDKNGTQLRPAVTTSERTDDATGQRWLTADLALAVLGAGDYAIELSLDDGGTARKVITAFRVTR